MQFVIFMSVFIYLVGFGFIIPFVPYLSQSFGATPLETGLLFSIFSIMQFLFAPMWGRLSDRWGRRPVFLICLIGEGISYILFGLAQSLPMLFVARAISGFFGASISTASAIISDVTPPEERSRGMALIGMAFGLGFVVGPSLGGILLSTGAHMGLSPVPFATSIVAGLCFVNTIVTYFRLPETLKERNAKKARVSRWAKVRQHLMQAGPREILISAFLVIGAMACMESTMVQFMTERYAWTIREVSFGFAYVGVVGALWQGGVVRRLIPKLGEHKLLMLGLVLFSMGLLLIPFAGSLTILAIVMTFFTMGHGLINPCLNGVFSLMTPKEEQGEGFGVLQSAMSLGRIAGPIFGGWIFGVLGSSSPYIFASFFGFLALVAIFSIATKVRHLGAKIH